MDDVFRALADPTRRSLLDELFKEDGQTLSALEGRLPMTRFGVMKHLQVLEEANLVATQRRGWQRSAGSSADSRRKRWKKCSRSTSRRPRSACGRPLPTAR